MFSFRYLLVACISIAMPLISCQSAEEPAEENAAPSAVVEEAPAPASLDPVSVDPDHYKLEFENEHVRVIRGTFNALDETPTHEDVPGVVVFLSDGSADIMTTGGETETLSWEGGTATWVEPATHSAVAKSDFEYVEVALKGEGGGEPTPVDENNATNVDSEHHTVEFENDRVRIVRMTYPAGQTSPEHVYFHGVNVFLTDAKAINHVEGEAGEENEIAAGSASWSEGTSMHATENTGDADFVILRVEIK